MDGSTHSISADTQSVVTPLERTCWNRFVKAVAPHSQTVMLIVILVAALFVTVMCMNDVTSSAKAIIGYSFLGAAVVTGILYVLYRKEKAKIDAHSLKINIVSYFGTNDSHISAANAKMDVVFDSYRPVNLVIQREKDITKGFTAHELPSSLMMGTFQHPVTGTSLNVYTIKFTTRNMPNATRVITIYQTSLASKDPQDCEYHCTGAYDSLAGLNENFTGPHHTDNASIIRTLLDDRNADYRLA